MQLIKLFTFLFLLFAFTQNVVASTVYETNAPLQNVVLSNSSLDSRNTTFIKIPTLTTFDRVALPLSDGGSFYYGVRNDPNNDSFPCTDVPMSNCYDDDTWITGPSGPITGVLKSTGVYEYVIGTTTLTTSSQYFFFEYNANITQTTGLNVTNASNGVSFSFNEFVGNTTYSTVMASMIFCNGNCTNYEFSPIPNLTAQAWARMITPVDSSTQPYSVNFNFQFNWGTTTDNAIIRFNSAYQSIIPEYLTANISGLQTHTFTRNFPAIDDDLEISIELLSSSSSVFISPTYTIKLRDISQLEADLKNPSPSACDNLIVGALCSIATFLFIPSETPTQTFSAVLDSLVTKKPFSYFSQTTSVISSVASSSNSAEFVNLEVTINLPPVSGTYPILTKDTLDSIYDEDTRLMVRTVIGYGLWIIFALTVIYMLLNIFNRAVYLGEQGNEKQSFSKRTKTIHER